MVNLFKTCPLTCSTSSSVKVVKTGEKSGRKEANKSVDAVGIDTDAVTLGAEVEKGIALKEAERDVGFQKPLRYG